MITELKDIRSTERSKTNLREYFRLNERIRINVRTIETFFEDKITNETYIERTGEVAEHVTINISAGGLQFFSQEHYRDNMHVEITLYFKETSQEFDPVTVMAKIMRTERIGNSQYQNVSVMYVNIDPKDRYQIERYIFVRQRDMIAEKRIGFL